MSAVNGRPRGGNHRGGVRRTKPESNPVVPEVIPGAREPAGFFEILIQPVDVGSWPVHPTIWWHPELKLEPPPSTGLRIERQHKAPLPGFAEIHLVESPAAASRRFEPHLQAPAVVRVPPQSDLSPSGWDPRIAATSGKGMK